MMIFSNLNFIKCFVDVKYVIDTSLFLLAGLSALLSHIPSVAAQIPIVGGQCPTKVSSSPIDLKEITGQWYEIEASPTFMEFPFKCISIKVPAFYERKSEISIDAVNRISKETSTIQKIAAKISDSSNEKDGKLMLTIEVPSRSPEGEVIHGPNLREHYQELSIQILATDNKNWALVWMCKAHEDEHANARTELIWVLSRQRILTEDQYNEVYRAKQSHGLEWIKTRDTIQSGCSKQQKEDEDDDDEY